MVRISVRKDVVDAMLAQARSAAYVECCGLLAGRDGAITRILPARNASQRPASEYEIAPEELFRLMREIRAAGLELLGIYHAHPSGDNAPSARDIERAFYPDAAYFIVSPRGEEEKDPDPCACLPAGRLRARMGHPPVVRAFAIRDGAVAELEVVAE
jgi:proteasome lid subunit RPN8/RPN11